jgi:YVTN family beta-propeller protein
MVRRILVFISILVVAGALVENGAAQRARRATKTKNKKASQRRLDDPKEEEPLNRELWEFARRTRYQSILPYVAAQQRKSKGKQTSEMELPTGWRIDPAGRQIEVGRLPYEAVPFAGKLVVLNTGYYSKEPQEISIVDPLNATIEKTLKVDSLFPSAIAGIDGGLYVSGGFSQRVLRFNTHFQATRVYEVGGFVGGIVAIDSQHLAVTIMAVRNKKHAYLNGGLEILNTSTGRIEQKVELGYFPFTIRYVDDKLFVTLLGEDKLLVYDRTLKLLKTLKVGLTPQEMCTDNNKLYVVNPGSDSLSVIDARNAETVSTITLNTKGTSFGAAPSSCAVHAGRLYVTLANQNVVQVLDARTAREVTKIPTAWYPTKVLIDGQQLIVVSAKGIHTRRPNPDGPNPIAGGKPTKYVLNLLKGGIALIPMTQLDGDSEAINPGQPVSGDVRQFKPPIKHVFFIIKENRTYDQVLGDLPKGNGDPKLTIFGESVSPIQHQLAREFVTLDNFFVDGEISVLGHSFTTSGYASPFIEWLGNVSYSDRWKGYPFGTVPATFSPQYLWDLLDEKRIDYRIYGENPYLFTRAYRIFCEMYGADSELARRFYDKTILAAAGEDRGTEFNELAQPYYGRAGTIEDAYSLLGDEQFLQKLSQFLTGDDRFARAVRQDDRLRHKFAEYLYHYPFNFRSWDLKYSDLDRVIEWKRDFDTQLRRGQVPQLNYIWLPNDHTDGSKSKILNPYQFVAQNDAALGRLVEIISHSPIWKDSLILVVEDDSQNGPDHVDATRTTAFAVGPYVKRGAVVSDRYDQLSMLRTIEIVLGLHSLNSAEQLAVPMFGIFDDQPNFAAFIPVAPSTHLANSDKNRYESLSRRQD